ncbi:Ubiquinone biosynthesis O-methyltransferase [bioreactor metagenome]|uniref:Ubiquinone biosynthesis O-methyltransferase n=1 Tax=bioreactor metagenome TaxID=1076179 RepID=A0A645D8F2_9ZZZZ
MNGYSYLAGCYDQLTADVDYPRWADYIEAQFKRAGRPVRTVLDLACGTGTLTWILAGRGYDMTGVDLSGDMLSQAAEKAETSGSEIPPLFLCQSMEKLDLNDTVDACVCCLDSVNHITSPARLRRAFARVHLFLSPGGLFLFDINSPRALMDMDGGMFIDETEDTYCVWRADYSARRRICAFGMDIFRRNGDLWRREREEHEEYAYTPEELTGFLKEAGFTRIRQYGNLKLRAPGPSENRIFFTARKVL